MVDIKKFVDKLVTTGMSKDKATDKVKKAIAKIKEKKEGVSDDEIVSLLEQAIEKSTSHKGERYQGICIGYDAKRNDNKKILDNAMAMYSNEATKQKAIDGGLIKEDVDKTGARIIVPLDPRKTIDKAGKIPNRNFGLPLREHWTRKCYFLIDGKVEQVNGNIDPVVGTEYIIYGKKYKFFIGAGKSGIQKVGVVDPIALWEKLYTFASESDFAIPIEEVSKLNNFEVRLTNGFVRNGGDTKTGGRWTTMYGAGGQVLLFGFSANEDTAVVLSDSNTGNEMLILVQGKPQKPDAQSTTVGILGAILNPASAENAELIGDLDASFTEN